jgi:hypothetical protein
MTVNSSDIVSGPYAGNDVASQFSYDFRVDLKTQLTVFETTDAGTVTALTIDTDYTVNDIGTDGGGTIDRIAGALPSGYSWYIRANYLYTQDISLASQGGFFPDVHEAAFDKLTFLSLQQEDLINRAVRLPDSYSGGANLQLPSPEASKTILWSDDGLSLVNGPSVGTFASYATNAATSATNAQLREWEAEAEALTADSYANQLKNVYVNIYTSDGDGTFTATASTDYSALHWASIAASVGVTDTGVLSTYTSSVVSGGTTFNQSSVLCAIHSDIEDSGFSYAGATGITVATLSSPSTYVYIDGTGTLQQQTSTPTRQDWNRKVFTMRIGVDTVAETILGFEYLNNPIGHYANSIRDVYAYLLAQGIPFKKDQVVTGRAGDLGFDVSAGSLLEFGGTGDIYNPNIRSFSEVTNTSYTLLSKTAVVSVETDLVKFWDNAGTITALGSTTVVGHRLYRFSDGNFAMQYGQGNYANMTLAKAGALIEEYELNPKLRNATFFGWWFIQETASNTGGTTLTEFKEYTIGIQGGSSSGLAGCLLKGNNGSDILDVNAFLINIGAAPLASPALTGIPTAPTAATEADDTQVANTEFTRNAIATYASTDVAAEMAGASVGSAGSYAFLELKTNGTRTPGATVPGSSCLYSGSANQTNVSPSGTWRAMGMLYRSGTTSAIENATLCLRIS